MYAKAMVGQNVEVLKIYVQLHWSTSRIPVDAQCYTNVNLMSNCII